MIAFLLIPGTCGIFALDSLALKRRPLIRDTITYGARTRVGMREGADASRDARSILTTAHRLPVCLSVSPGVALLLLCVFMSDAKIQMWEAIILVALYIVYILVV